VFQNCSGTKRSKQRRSNLYRNEEEKQMVFQSFSGTKRNKQMVFQSFSGAKRNIQRYSKAFQELKGTRQISPILFRTKVEQSQLFQKFQDRIGISQSIPKGIKVEQKELSTNLIQMAFQT